MLQFISFLHRIIFCGGEPDDIPALSRQTNPYSSFPTAPLLKNAPEASRTDAVNGKWGPPPPASTWRRSPVELGSLSSQPYSTWTSSSSSNRLIDEISRSSQEHKVPIINVSVTKQKDPSISIDCSPSEKAHVSSDSKISKALKTPTYSSASVSAPSSVTPNSRAAEDALCKKQNQSSRPQPYSPSIASSSSNRLSYEKSSQEFKIPITNVLPSPIVNKQRDLRIPIDRSSSEKAHVSGDSISSQAPKTPTYSSASKSASSSVTPNSREALNSRSKGVIPVYKIPQHLKEQIEKNGMPDILREPVSSSSYINYFACLLYAEDLYLEKWSEYLLKDVTLELHKKGDKMRRNNMATKNVKKGDYVAFQIDSIPERRPYLLSRDFVFLRPLHRKSNNSITFEGSIVRVVKTKTVIAEFNDNFHSQHKPENRYDVSFSFNRVCLKRAHNAVANALGPVLFHFLFPVGKSRFNLSPFAHTFYTDSKVDHNQRLAVFQILELKSPPPYLIQGPPSTTINYHPEKSEPSKALSKTGLAICESIVKLYRDNDGSRILICTPKNITCDLFMSSLSKIIPEWDMFRTNAAFRDPNEVPDDIFLSSSFDDYNECFTCPPLSTLEGFRVISSTYMSSFRLSNAGIGADHFTHIFLVDASSVAEPEAIVPLASLANEQTVVVVSGCVPDSPWYVRSNIARRYGLKVSYFERLLRREPYSTGDPSFVCSITEAN